MGGVDEHIVGASGNLYVAFSLQFRGGLVVGDLVGAKNVAAVVAHHIAGEGQGITHAGLALRLPMHGHTGRGRGFRQGDGQNFLAWVVRKLGGGIGLHLAGRSGIGGVLRGKR